MKCPVCNEVFASHYLLLPHIYEKHRISMAVATYYYGRRVALNSYTTWPKCPLCSQVFERSQALIPHMDNVHRLKSQKKYTSVRKTKIETLSCNV